MAFIRYSVMTPKPGQSDRLKSLIGEMIAYHRTREGFIAEYLLEPDQHDLHGFIGRCAVWESEAAANATAPARGRASRCRLGAPSMTSGWRS